jgi:hypothetical protein
MGISSNYQPLSYNHMYAEDAKRNPYSNSSPVDILLYLRKDESLNQGLDEAFVAYQKLGFTELPNCLRHQRRERAAGLQRTELGWLRRAQCQPLPRHT